MIRSIALIAAAFAVSTGSALGQEIEVDAQSRRSVQLVAVYLGSIDCGPCLADETKQTVRDVLAAAREEAAGRNLDYHTIGAALDADWEEGIELLESTAEFDELTSGGSWLNSASLEHLGGDDTEVTGVPHVVILTRAIRQGPGKVELLGKNVLVRLMGAPEMREWLASGGSVF